MTLFDGRRLGFGHIGDSRAYLVHDGTLRQLTTDHTFVQTLIDDGRITEEEARTHPHRNLILKAIDSVHEVEPDLFHVDIEPGDRVLLCSDGVLSLTDAPDRRHPGHRHAPTTPPSSWSGPRSRPAPTTT